VSPKVPGQLLPVLYRYDSCALVIGAVASRLRAVKKICLCDNEPHNLASPRARAQAIFFQAAENASEQTGRAGMHAGGISVDTIIYLGRGKAGRYPDLSGGSILRTPPRCSRATITEMPEIAEAQTLLALAEANEVKAEAGTAATSATALA
jgi:hypothetical protein